MRQLRYGLSAVVRGESLALQRGVNRENATFPNSIFLLDRLLNTPDDACSKVCGVTKVERFAGVKRVNYFAGQILGAQDFRDEQAYFIEKRRLLNRALLGRGIVAGLSVSVSAGSSAATVIVEPGLAIDNEGREIELRAAVSLAIPSAAGLHQYILVEYTERETNVVALPIATSETVASRIEEGTVVRFSDDDDAGVSVGRIARSGSGWRIDHAFKPSRCR